MLLEIERLAQLGNIKSTEALIGDVNAVNEKGETLLHIAVEHGYIDMVKWVFEKNSKLIEAVDCTGWTALERAVWYRKTKVVSFLLEQVELDDAFFIKLLSHAFVSMRFEENYLRTKESEEIVELLVNNLSDPANVLGNLDNTMLELEEAVAKVLIFSILRKNLTEKKPNFIQENKELSRFWNEVVAKINRYLGDEKTGTNQAFKKDCIAKVELATKKTLRTLAFFKIPTVNQNVSEAEKTLSTAVPTARSLG